jgi:hypothetical protein
VHGVANLIKTCCFEGAAYDLVTSLGPERFTEWKAALINQAAGKVPNLFRLLEADVRDGRFQPHPEEGALKYRLPTPGYDFTELVGTDMPQLRALCTDLRRYFSLPWRVILSLRVIGSPPAPLVSAVSRAPNMSTSLLGLIVPWVFSSSEVLEGVSSVHPSGLLVASYPGRRTPTSRPCVELSDTPALA